MIHVLNRLGFQRLPHVARLFFAYIIISTAMLADDPAPPMSGMRLWLKADAGITPVSGRVPSWANQVEGSNNFATQSSVGAQPTLVEDGLYGRPVVRFDGTDDWFQLPDFMPSTTAQAGDAFVVVKVIGGNSALWNLGTATYNYYTYGGNITEGFGANPSKTFSFPALPLSEFHIYNVTAASDGRWQARQNGRLFFNATGNSVGFRSNPVIGRRGPTDGSYVLKGDIAEIIIYDRSLSDTERESVGKYLNNKYAIVTPPEPPTQLSALALSNSQVHLAWTMSAGNGAHIYEVERKEVIGSDFVLVTTVSDAMDYQDETVEPGKSYVYRVRARNYAGVSEYSNESPVTTPVNIEEGMPKDDLRLWLKADAGLAAGGVGAWPDQSGVANHATQSTSSQRPTLVADVLNGRPVVRFDGIDDWLQLPNFMPSTTAQAGDAFVVVKVGVGVDCALWNLGTGTYNYYPYSGNITEGFGAASAKIFSRPALPLTEFHIYNVTAASDGRWQARQNGRLFFNATGNSVGFRSNPVIGRRGPTDGAYILKGDIAEIIIYDRTLSDAERESVGKYLNNKYAIVTPPEPPTQLSALALSNSQVHLAWTMSAGNGAHVYEVERKEVMGSDFVLVATVSDAMDYLDGTAEPGKSYTYRVRARNYAGTSAYSNESGVTTPVNIGSGMPLENMRLWLKADAGLAAGGVGAWSDQSGVANHATQSTSSQRPTLVADVLNGRPVVRFDGIDDWLQLPNFMPSTVATAGDAFVVVKVDGGVNCALWNLGTGTYNYYPYSGNITEGFGANPSKTFSLPALPLTGFHVYNVMAATDGQWQASQNGGVFFNATGNSVGFRSNPVIGRRGPGDGAYILKGDVAEIIIYSRSLSEAERERVNYYLFRKYNFGLDVLTSLPAEGLYQAAQDVTLESPDVNAEIYYTLDGSAPVKGSSSLYTGAISISTSTKVRAIAYVGDQITSNELVAFYRIGDAPASITPLSGLSGTYFEGADFTGSSTRRLDVQLNNPSLTTLPAGWQGNSVSARWTGDVIAQFTENHTFTLNTNGGVQVWFNDQLVVDDWTGSTSRTFTFESALTAGSRYPIKVEFQRTSSTLPALTLQWSGFSTTTGLIPQSQLVSGHEHPVIAATPAASPVAGLYGAHIGVELTTPIPATGARFHYTLDGSEPTDASALYTGPVTLSQDVTLRAKAFATGYVESGTLVASYTFDNQPPVLSDPTFNGGALPTPVTANGTFGITATDASGVSRVDFHLDGVLLASDTISADGFTAPFAIEPTTDGAHTLTVQAWDNANTPSAILTVPLSVALPAPAAPVITSPANNSKVNRESLTVRGTTQKNALVTLHRGGISLGSTTAAADGAFSLAITLVPGQNDLTATAQNRNPTPSGSSSVISVAYDNTVPAPPTGLTATQRSAGRIELNWLEPASGLASGYYLFRSSSPIPADADLLPANALGGGIIRTRAYTDTPSVDGRYYYRALTAYTVGSDVSVSAPSNQAEALSDRIAPTATVTLQPLGTNFDNSTNRFGRGLVQATVTVSERLAATPFFNLTTTGSALFVDLSAQGELTYTGIVTIQSTTPSGPLGAVFSALDIPGNRGTEITLTPSAVIDTVGPRITGLTPGRFIEGVWEDLSTYNSIRNEPVAPATAVTLNWRVTLDEAPKSGTEPTFTASLSSQPALTLPVTVTDAGDTDDSIWLVTLVLPTTAGAEIETLTLGFSATDDLDNEGNTIVPPHVFQVYQGNLPPLAVPAGLSAEALPAGAIFLDWEPVAGAAAYVLQAKGPADADFTDLEVLVSTATAYTYTPAIDGLHSYRLASVRTENGQDSNSGWSDIATARSDRVPPPAPDSLALAVVAQGVQATWAAPAAGLGDVAGYSLYRDATVISDLAGLTPAVETIAASLLTAVDASPAGATPHYAIVSYDEAGNRSEPATGFANVTLLPVRTLTVIQSAANAAPTVSWDPAPGSVIDGFNLSIDGSLIAVDGNETIPAATRTYTDSGYPGGDRLYLLTTVSGPDSRERSLHMPAVSLSLASGSELKRGLMNTVNVVVRNDSASPLTDARLMMGVAGRNHVVSAPISLGSAAETIVPIVVGGYDDLPSSAAPVTLTLTLTPHAGETVTLVRAATVAVAEGALTVELIPGEFTRGGTGKLRFKLTNPGSQPIEFKTARSQGAQPSDEVRIHVSDASGSRLSSTPLHLVLGDDVVTLPGGVTVVRVAPGATYTSPEVSVPVPFSAPALIMAALEIDSVYHDFGGSTQVKLKGPRAQASASTLETSYSATLTSVSPVESNGDVPVVVSGIAHWRTAGLPESAVPAPGQPVVVSIRRDGFVRTETVFSDATGLFTYAFVPPVTEAGGFYQVWASHPEALSPPATPDTFTIRRVLVSPQVFNMTAPRNYRQTLPVKISTGAGTSVQNLRAVLVGDLPAAVSFATEPLAVIAPGQQVTLPLSMIGLAATPESLDEGTLQFHVLSDDGQGGNYTWATLTVNYRFTEARPILQATPMEVQLGVQPGQTASETLTLKNQGFAALEGGTLTLVDGTTARPAWITLQTPAAFGRLDVGESTSVQIAAAVPAGTAEQVYSLYLRVAGANLTPIDYPVTVTVSPSGQGGAIFKVVDPYYQLTLPDDAPNPAFDGLVNVPVTLEKESLAGIPAVIRNLRTDTTGEANFQNLPAGRYKLRIVAAKHETYEARITIRPGVIHSEQIQLTYSPVSFTWEVVPVTFQDKYEIVITSTFETNVPVPVLVIEPGSINLPKMCPGQVYTGEFRITNHGLVDADSVAIPVPPSDGYFSYEILDTVPDKIPAKQTIKIAYRVKCLKALPGQCDQENAVAGTVTGAGDPGSGGGTATVSSGFHLSSVTGLFGSPVFGGLSSILPVLLLVALVAGAQALPRSNRWANILRLLVATKIGLGMPMGATAQSAPPSSGCGVYVSGFRPVAGYICANGQRYEITLQVPIYSPYGKCPSSGRGTGPGPSTPPPQTHTGGVGGGGPPGIPGNIGGAGSGTGSSTVSSDNCFPKPPPCTIPTTVTFEERDCKKYKITTSCEGRKEELASSIDLATRDYTDAVVDLDVPVPGGKVGVSRSYEFGCWRMHTADRLYSMDNGLSLGGPPLVLNGRAYLKHGMRLVPEGMDVGSVQIAGSLSWPMGVVSLSSVPEGEFRQWGSSDDKIVKSAAGTYVWSDDSYNERHYDVAGRLVSRWRHNQLIASYFYNSQDQLSHVVDRAGRTVLTFGYTDGRLTEAQDIGGRVTRYTYNAKGLLETVTDPLFTVYTYTYNDSDLLATKRTHHSGAAPEEDHLVTLSYSGLVDSGSRDPILFPPIRDYRVSPPTPASPDLIIAGHSNYGDRPRGFVTGVTHNTGENSALGFKHDSSTATYSSHVINASGRDVESVFDAHGVLVAKFVNGERIYKMEYDNRTRVITRGASSRTIEELDEKGRLVRRVNPDGGIDTYEYDQSVNDVIRHTDPLGVVTAYTYNEYGQVLTETEAVDTPLERVTVNEYHPGTTLLARRTAPDGRQTAYIYDSLDRLERIYDPAEPARETLYTHDDLARVLTETDALGRVTTYNRYDNAGRVLEETNPLGEKTFFTYEGDNLVEVEVGRTTTAAGRISRYTYDAKGRRLQEKRVTVAGIESVYKTYAYNADGKLISETNALGQITAYTYDAAGNPSGTQVPDADGGTSTAIQVYDALNRPSESVSTTGTRTLTDYDVSGRPARVTEAAGTNLARTTTYRYDLAGRLLEEKFAALGTTVPVLTTINTYDLLGRVTVRGGNRVYPTTIAYDDAIATDRSLTESDARGNVTRYAYDAAGRLEHVFLNDKRVNTHVYDRVGNRVGMIDGEGNHRHIRYDVLNRPSHESIPFSSTQTLPAEWWTNPVYVLQATTYTAQGEVHTVTRYPVIEGVAHAVTTTRLYDDFGRLASETEAGSASAPSLTLTFAYDDADNMLTVTYPPVASSGATQPTTETYVRSPYNAALVDAFIDRAGNDTHFVYDAAFRVLEETNILGGTTQREFDDLGRVSKVTTITDTVERVTFTQYHPLLDQPTAITHPDHVPVTHERIETFAYDTRGKLITKGGAGGYPLVYRYDAVGNLEELQDGNGKITKWTYTDRNQVDSKTYADTTAHHYTYDDAGRLATRRDALNRTTTYTFNAFGLPETIDYPTDTDVVFTYEKGLRRSMTDASGATTWTYDTRGRPKTETQSRSGRTLTFDYDSYSQRTGLSIQALNAELAPVGSPWRTGYGYDNTGRLRTVLDDRLSSGQPYVYAYPTKTSPISQVTTPTGMKTTKSLDTQGRLLHVGSQLAGAPVGSYFASHTYSYNAAGQRETEAVAGSASDPRTRTFTYDRYRQLEDSTATVDGSPETFTFDYDPIGNRLEVGRQLAGAPSGTTTYKPDVVNQYETITGLFADTPTYDDNGNTRTTDGKLLRYDEENRLIEVSDLTRTVTYIYDGFGRRVERIDVPASGTLSATRYVYDGWRVMEELAWDAGTSTWALASSYTRGLDLSGTPEGAGGIGGLLALSKPNGATWTTASYFYDGNGNVTHLVDDAGTTMALYTYGPFGERLTATGAWADVNTVQFSSKERDAFTGFYYYGFRYYNPTTGRWLSRDPIEENGGVNLYGMVNNDPVDLIDQLGLKKWSVDDKACTVTLTFRVQLQFKDFLNQKWSASSKQKFRADFVKVIEDTFNKNNFLIKSSSKDDSCPCKNGYVPKLEIELVADEKWSIGEDWEVDVMASPTSSGIYTGENTGRFFNYGNLMRTSNNMGNGQIASVHEFGHAIGLEHPNNQSVLGDNSIKAYQTPQGGKDRHGRDVSRGDLMGMGMGLRPFYFDDWVKQVNKAKCGCEYAIQ